MTFAAELTALATELKVQQQLFQKNTFATVSAQIYTNLADVLDRGWEACEAEATLSKMDFSVQETIGHLAEAMEELADRVRNLAVVREGYVKPQGAGSVAPGMADLEAAREPHADVRRRLKELVRDTENAATSVGRHGGAANSGQHASEERSYRAVSARIEGEYWRGRRRSG